MKDNFPFERFEKHVGNLDKVLNVGGLLVIFLTNYRFTDVAIAGRYEVVQIDTGFMADYPFAPKFDRESQRYPDEAYAPVIFRKLRD